jgi:hypothetical protein
LAVAPIKTPAQANPAAVELEAIVTHAVAAGVQAGRRKAIEDVIEVAARKLFEDEAEMVMALLDQGTPEQVMAALPILREEVIIGKWDEAMRPILQQVVASQVGG